MDIIIKALPYVINIATGVILAICTATINKIRTEREKDKQDREEEQKKQAAKEQAISDGLQALLRESIVSAYNKYTDRGYCPIYAKESLKKAYKSYEALGGNDVAKGLYHKILDMPEDKRRDDEEGGKYE